jgi:hypothetical protein
LRRHRRAAEAYRQAIARDDTRATWHARLGRALARTGDHTAAADAYRQAIARDDTRATWHTKLGRSLERSVGIDAAVEECTERVRTSPSDGAYVYLCSATRRLGDPEGALAHADEGLREKGPNAPLLLLLERAKAATGALAWEEATVAWEAVVETAAGAVEADWLSGFGRALEGAERHGEAAGAYRRAQAIVSEEDEPWRHNALREWAFRSTYCDARTGTAATSDDRLTIEVREQAEPFAPTTETAGLLWGSVTHTGLQVSGRLVAPGSTTVEIVLDGRPVIAIDVRAEVDGGRAAFDFTIKHQTLRHFPPSGHLDVRTASGHLLANRRGGRGLRVSVPHGDGSLLARLGGDLLTKKGTVRDIRESVAGNERAILAAYVHAKELFADRFGVELFLLYGTLLGVHRDGRLIPGDDDVDLGFATTAGDPLEAKAQALEVVHALLAASHDVAIKRRGGLFLLHLEDIPFSVYPLWFADGRTWGHTSIVADREDFVPAREVVLGGFPLLVPRRPEVFLEGTYGPGWRVPSSTFRHHRSRATRRRIRAAGLSPSESAAMITENERRRRRDPSLGRLTMTDDTAWLVGS